MLFVISNANIILESEKNLNCDIFLKKILVFNKRVQ